MTRVPLNGYEQAEFKSRVKCIACECERMTLVDQGLFGEEPHLTMLRSSPWGESPLPYLESCAWELVRCDDCETLFHKRILDDKWNARRFSDWMTEDAIARFEIEHGLNTPAVELERSKHDLDRLLCIEKMTRQMRKGSPLTVLDFGCGWGRFVALGALLGFEAYGVDRSTARLNGTKSPGRIFTSLEEYRERIAKPPHAVTLFEVLEHLEDPLSILRDIHAELRPGGVLVVEVPNCDRLRAITTAQDLGMADGIDHINAFTPKSLTQLVRRAGFEPVRPPTAQVTADWLRSLKREARRLVGRFRRPSTQQFFRRV